MIQSKSAGHAKAYFSEALSKSDYYISDQELAGVWQGRLAERLGLEGVAGKDDFHALCENIHPKTGGSLTPRYKEERRTGYDINFHCPKSVSLVHVFAKDDHVLNAFRDSVSETMTLIESDTKTRVRAKGACDDRLTSELAWAHFVHQTARPVEGQLPDPHLHSHCFVFNATWDAEEQRCKAGQFGDIKRDMPFYQAHFHKALADRLAGLGYNIRRTDKSFEIEGVPQSAIELFSKRTDEIGRVAKEKGITDEQQLSELGAKTRATKQKGCDMAELREDWRGQIKALSEEGLSNDIVRYNKINVVEKSTAEIAVEHGVAHCFERASVVTERKLLATAYRYGIGLEGVSLDQIDHAFKSRQDIIKVRDGAIEKCTTIAILNEEKAMVQLAKQGTGAITPLYETPPELALTGQQADAVNNVLTTSNRVSIIRGAAGTGKTTLMTEAVKHIEAAGKEVVVIAPTAQASRTVLRAEGFEEADTVAKFLTDPVLKAKAAGNVLWVDEAGLLGTADMKAILEIATKSNAQVVLGGDTRQHASVIRGDAMRILNTVAGVRVAEVSKIYRQKDKTYRQAVEDLSKGDVGAAFEKLEGIGSVKSVEQELVGDKLLDDYIKVIKQGKSALVISPTHEQGEQVTDKIRSRLRDLGQLGKRETVLPRYRQSNMTEAEKSDARNFNVGQLLQFTQNCKGFQRGSMWTVFDSGAGVELKSANGESKSIPLQNSRNFDVFEVNEINLSKGDKIRVTRNGFDLDRTRLSNGDMLEVHSVTAEGVVLRNPLSRHTFRVSTDFGHFAHAHCVTSHASQGKTVDEVLIYQPSATFPATDAKQFYVSVSRGREKATIYTDDKEELLLHAELLGDRQSATELVSIKSKHTSYVLQKERTYKEQEGLSKNRTDYEPER